MSKSTLMITGTCGFVLGNFIRKVIYEKQPYNFVSIDRINSNTTNSMYWNKNHTFHVADIRDQHIIDTIFQFEKPDIVLHGAALTFSDHLINDPNAFVESNVLGTQVIINACIKYNVKKLVLLSSDEVYKQFTEEQISERDEYSGWTEESFIDPRNSYSATKACSEVLVKAAGLSHGLIYNITRSSNNYGPRQNVGKLIPKVIKCILQDKPIPIYGQGLQTRDWLHVFDNCSAIMEVVNNGIPNEIYNIGANQEFSNIEVVQEICNVMGKGHNLISFVEDPRKSYDFRYSMNCDKIKSLGWKPEIKFKDGLKNKCVPWYLANQWWFKN